MKLPLLLVPSLTLAVGACATAPPPGRFPSASALAQLAALPVMPAGDAAPVAFVHEWQLTGPLPDVVDGRLHALTTAWDALLVDAGATGPSSVLTTEAAACAAREVALFRATQPGAPAPGLLRFIAARCGVAAPGLLTGCQVGAAGAGVSENQIYEREAPALRAAVAATLERVGAPVVEAGIWVARRQTHPLICWALAPRTFTARRALLIPDAAGRVTIDGDLADDAGQIDAFVSVGRLGVRRCSVAVESPFPSLSVSCPVDRTDTAAWIDIDAISNGELVARPVLSLLAWPSGTPGDTYFFSGADTSLAPLDCASPPDGTPLPDAVAGCINQARQTTGTAPLALATEQGKTVTALVPHLFGGALAQDPPAMARDAALGVRAGWNVNAELAFGQLAQAAQEAQTGPPDVTLLVAALMEHPNDRVALLDPRARFLAVGTGALPGAALTGVAAATYSTVANMSPDRSTWEAQVIVQINAVRAARGKPPIAVFRRDHGRTSSEAENVAAGSRTPLGAVKDATNSTSGYLKRGHVHGWWRQAEALWRIDVPAPLLRLPEVAIGVARYRPAGEPWTRFVVLMVAPHQGPIEGGLDPGVVFSADFIHIVTM